MGDLTKNFSRSEFACRCGCGRGDVSPQLVTILQALRDALGRPLIITSAVRCEKHNREVGGEMGSAHVRGLAVDVACSSSRERYDLLWKAIEKFDRIGIAKSFIHLDIDASLPRCVVWVY